MKIATFNINNVNKRLANLLGWLEAATASSKDDALIQPESRAAYRRLLGRSWTDAIRHLHPAERIYTYWHYKRARWQRDAGLRLDHLLLSPNLRDRLVDASVDRDVRGREGASDHAPAWIRIL